MNIGMSINLSRFSIIFLIFVFCCSDDEANKTPPDFRQKKFSPVTHGCCELSIRVISMEEVFNPSRLISRVDDKLITSQDTFIMGFGPEGLQMLLNGIQIWRTCGKYESRSYCKDGMYDSKNENWITPKRYSNIDKKNFSPSSGGTVIGLRIADAGRRWVSVYSGWSSYTAGAANSNNFFECSTYDRLRQKRLSLRDINAGNVKKAMYLEKSRDGGILHDTVIGPGIYSYGINDRSFLVLDRGNRLILCAQELDHQTAILEIDATQWWRRDSNIKN